MHYLPDMLSKVTINARLAASYKITAVLTALFQYTMNRKHAGFTVKSKIYLGTWTSLFQLYNNYLAVALATIHTVLIHPLQYLCLQIRHKGIVSILILAMLVIFIHKYTYKALPLQLIYSVHSYQYDNTYYMHFYSNM